MAGYGSIFSTFSIVTVIILVFCSSLQVLAGTDHYVDHEGQEDNMGATDAHPGHHNTVTRKYGLVWSKSDSAQPTPRHDFSHFNDDIESVVCTSDTNCTAALPGVEVALLFDSNIPSAPYCITEEANSTGFSHCTCGEERCVSRSYKYPAGSAFFYCGPCGHVGSQCTTHKCSHDLAECTGSYCECTEGGTFYDLSYCYIPLYGQNMFEIITGTIGVVFIFITLAYGYHLLRRSHRHRHRRESTYSERGSGGGRRESPPEDTPPAYDDVTEKLPSYQDALRMSATGDDEDGVSNPAFEGDEAAPPTYTTPNAATHPTSGLAPSRPKTGLTAQHLDHTTSTTVNGCPEHFHEKQTPKETETGTNSTPPVTEEQHSLAPQPIERLLHNALLAQHGTTTTTRDNMPT